MCEKRRSLPALFHHKASGQSAVRIRDPGGKKRTVHLGTHGSQEAQERYREVISEHLAGQLVRVKPRVRLPSEWPTIGQLAADFLTHARRFYRDETGAVSAEVSNFTCAFRVLLERFATEHVDQFTVRDLTEVRQSLVDARRYCRKTINDTIRRCKAIFRWGAEHQIVPAGTWHQLAALRGLTVGRGGVRESVAIQPVPWGMVEPILEHLTPPLRAAVLLQWHAGLRPTEALRITRGQLDMSNEIWVYRMHRHKGTWRGLERAVFLGPKCREVLTPLLKVDPGVALLSPVDAVVAMKQKKRANRATPITKQTRERDRRAKGKAPYVGDFYRVDVYRKAIHRACELAGVAHWSPHRLRHAAATRIALAEGIEARKAVLGHADIRMTERYAAAADAEIARAMAAKHC
jgi:integrase